MKKVRGSKQKTKWLAVALSLLLLADIIASAMLTVTAQTQQAIEVENTEPTNIDPVTIEPASNELLTTQASESTEEPKTGKLQTENAASVNIEAEGAENEESKNEESKNEESKNEESKSEKSKSEESESEESESEASKIEGPEIEEPEVEEPEIEESEIEESEIEESDTEETGTGDLETEEAETEGTETEEADTEESETEESETEETETEEMLFGMNLMAVAAGQTAEFSVEWADNSNAAGKRPASSGTGSGTTLDASAAAGLFQVYTGSGQVSLASGSITVTQANYSLWKVEVSNLQTGETYYLGMTKPEQYKVNYDQSGKNYSGTSIVNQYLAPIEATISWKDGKNTTNQRPSSITVHMYESSAPTTELCQYVISGDTAADSWNLSKSFEELPAYTESGAAQNYIMKINGTTVASTSSATGDYYDVAYDNGTITTDTANCRNGGSIVLTIRGNASFSGEKVWQDDDDTSARTARAASGAELALWRYANKNDYGWEEGSPVRVGGSPVTHTVLTTVQVDTFTLANFTPVSTLPKYDEDGFLYIYFVKETITGEYQQKLENVGEWAGQNSDNILYNGGTIYNVRAKDMSIAVEISWKAKATSYAWENEEFTVILQRKLKGAADTAYVALPDLAKSGESNQEYTYTVPMFDEQGKAYEYKAESAKIKDSTFSYTTGAGLETGTVSFNINANEDYHYESCLKKVVTDGNVKYEVTNQLKGKAKLILLKRWKGSWNLSTEPVLQYRVTRYANNIPDAFSQTITSNPHTTYAAGGYEAVWEFTGTFWEGTGTALNGQIIVERFNEEGYEYTYYVEETGPNLSSYIAETGLSYYTEVYYNQRTQSATIMGENAPQYELIVDNITGEIAKVIDVEKEWLDDGDIDHRGSVKVGLYRNVGGTYEKVEGKTATLTAGNQWKAKIELPIDADYNDCIVLEESITRNGVTYPVTNETVTADATYFTDDNFSYAKKGTVSTDEHQYKVSVSSTKKVSDPNIGMRVYYKITNLRVGKLTIDIKKTWKDGENSVYTVRPKGVKFTLSRNGSVVGNESLTPPLELSVKEQSAEGVFTDLPKYDAYGVAYTYSVTEMMTDEHGNEVSTEYISAVELKLQTKAEPYKTIDHDTYIVEATNYRDEPTDISVDVIWRDADRKSARPDIYLTILRQTESQGSSGQWETVGYHEAHWSKAEHADEEYHLRCTFKALPRYNAEGKRYTYAFRETITANASLYTIYSYDDSTGLVESGQTSEGYCNLTTQLTSNGYLQSATTPIKVTKEKGTIVNCISADVETAGIKTWLVSGKGITDAALLPDAELTLHRKFKNVGTSTYATIGNVAAVVLENGNRAFSFKNPLNDNKSLFPKFDEYGREYDYTVKERFVTGDAAQNAILDILYPEATNRIFDELTFGLQNVFVDTYTRNIKVEKTWEQLPADLIANEAERPFARFILYRYQTGASPTVLETVETITIQATGNAPSGTVTKIGSFKPVQTYAPNGKMYVYVVKEDVDYAPSYDNSSIKESGIASNPTESSHTVTLSNSGFSLSKSDDVVTFIAPDATVTAVNKYKGTEVINSIKGTITWEDDSNGYESRPLSPTDITLALTRTAKAQSGVGNQKTEEIDASKYTITWSGWDYTITPKSSSSSTEFAVYSSNGIAWDYKVTQSITTGSTTAANYKIKTASSTKTATGAVEVSASGIITKQLQMNNLVNQLYKTLTLEKTWVNDAEYGLRPTQLSFQIQYRLTGASEWTNLKESSGSFTMSERSGKWSLTTKALPQYKVDASLGSIEYEYFITETVPTSYTCVKSTVTPEASKIAGGRFLNEAAVSLKESKTTVNFENEVVGSTLHVLLEFDDEDNLYRTRPDNVEVVLKRKIEGGAWEIVKDTVNSEAVVLTITENTEGKYEAVFENLPQKNASGRIYQYSAEVCNTVEQASIFYHYGYQVASYHRAEDADEAIERAVDTYILYTLPMVEITAEQTWTDKQNQDGLRPEQVTLQLLDDAAPLVNTNGEAVTLPLGKQGEDYVWSGTFAKVPKYKNEQSTVSERDYSIAVENIGTGTPIAEYTTGITNTGLAFSVTSTHEPNTRELSIKKEWEDFSDVFQDRPNEITVYVKANCHGENYYVGKAGDVVTFYDTKAEAEAANAGIRLTSATWEASISGLPVSQNETGTDTTPGSSHTVTYSLEEIEVAEYEVKSFARIGDAFTLTNIYILMDKPKTLEVTLELEKEDGSPISPQQGIFEIMLTAQDEDENPVEGLQYSYLNVDNSKTLPQAVAEDGIIPINLAEHKKIVITNIPRGTTVFLQELEVGQYLTRYDKKYYNAGESTAASANTSSNNTDLTAEVSFEESETNFIMSAEVNFFYREVGNIIVINNKTERVEGETEALPPLGGTVQVTTYIQGSETRVDAESEETASAATAQPSTGDRIELAWKPQKDSEMTMAETWGTGNSITIQVQPAIDSSSVITFTYERQSDNSWICTSGNDTSWTSYGLSPLIGNIKSDAQAGMEGILRWEISNLNALPYDIQVDVNFIPTLVVENITKVEDINASTGRVTLGGKVRTATSTEEVMQGDDKYAVADGGAEDEASRPRYLAETIVYGTADTEENYVVDLDNLVIGLPESFGAIRRGDVENKFSEAANGLETVLLSYYGAEDSLPKFYPLQRGSYNVSFQYANRSVPITGSVNVIETNAKGFATQVEIIVDKLVIPLDVGIPFITEAEAIRRRGSSDNQNESTDSDSISTTASLQVWPVSQPWLTEDTLIQEDTENNKDNQNDKTQPKTGDTSNQVVTWMILLAGLACCGIGAVLHYRRKKKEE